jgi:hypothetical protein
MISSTEGWALSGQSGEPPPSSRPWKYASVLYYKDNYWQKNPVPVLDGHLYDLVMLNSDEGWAVGDKGRIAHYFDGKWQEVFSPTDKRLFAISMLSPEEGWAVGQESTILHYSQTYV